MVYCVPTDVGLVAGTADRLVGGEEVEDVWRRDAEANVECGAEIVGGELVGGCMGKDMARLGVFEGGEVSVGDGSAAVGEGCDVKASEGVVVVVVVEHDGEFALLEGAGEGALVLGGVRLPGGVSGSRVSLDLVELVKTLVEVSRHVDS